MAFKVVGRIRGVADHALAALVGRDRDLIGQVLVPVDELRLQVIERPMLAVRLCDDLCGARKVGLIVAGQIGRAHPVDPLPVRDKF